MNHKNKLILDACCGGRLFWYDKNNPLVLFQDVRVENKGFVKDRFNFCVAPDVVADFRRMPYPDCTFKHVVFDPPHLLRGGLNGWQVQKYGILNKNTWRDDILHGFSECMRVLDNYGILVFKWNEESVSFKEILGLLPINPLYGHLTSRSGKTKWFVFMKLPSYEIGEQ